VEPVDENGVIADGKRIPSATMLWTAGVAPAPILKLLGAKTDRAGRVSVGPFMNVPDVSDVEPKHPFRYSDKGNMPVVGKNFAILDTGDFA
jgi:NADH dehydrogenase